MRVLVIGSGGREHALAWRLSRSASVTSMFAIPGNPGISRVATCLPGDVKSPEDLLALARSISPDLTVVGPEVPLVAGVVDAFRAAGFRIVGPTRAAARLEGSKIFAKQFFEQHGIPTARFVAAGNTEEARAALKRFTYPVVIKADGLAAGKGVTIAENQSEAEQAISALGPGVVIEEFLTGEEVSFIALCDGKNIVVFPPCQDHKRAFDGDQGPNTGGMGAYSDDRILTSSESQRIVESIIRPTVEATGFTGFLYAGLMMTGDGPKLLEYNVRLGDPETQPLMRRFTGDFGALLAAAADGRLSQGEASWTPDPSVCIVLASGGYPGAFETGKLISGIDRAERAGAVVFHAGTRQGAAGLETAGGRVLGVTTSASTLAEAVGQAYTAAGEISFAGAHYRRDIGRKGLQRYNE